MRALRELLERHQDLKADIREVENQMADIVLHFEGTLAEAIGAGLVRPNFPAPARLVKHLKQEYQSNK